MTAMMLPIAQAMDRAGFAMIVHGAGAVRRLRALPEENPGKRRECCAFRHAARGYCRSKSLVGFGMVPDDIVELWIERLHANGFRVVGTLDALFDVENMLVSIRRAKQLGMYSVGALVFCDSPVHTDEVYARTARALIERGDVDAIMLKDSGALLTPDRIRTIVPALKAVMGRRPLELHSHCNTGLAPSSTWSGKARRRATARHDNSARQRAAPATALTLRNLAVGGFRRSTAHRSISCRLPAGPAGLRGCGNG